jgi:hypothetical protein
MRIGGPARLPPQPMPPRRRGAVSANTFGGGASPDENGAATTLPRGAARYWLKSASPSKADIRQCDWLVRFGPFPDSCIATKQTLFDHFVRAGEHRCRQVAAERLGGFQIDHQLVLGRRLHRQTASLRPLSAQSWAMQERPQRQRLLRPKLGRSCRAVLAGASASVKSDAKWPRCLALYFWI